MNKVTLIPSDEDLRIGKILAVKVRCDHCGTEFLVNKYNFKRGTNRARCPRRCNAVVHPKAPSTYHEARAAVDKAAASVDLLLDMLARARNAHRQRERHFRRTFGEHHEHGNADQ